MRYVALSFNRNVGITIFKAVIHVFHDDKTESIPTNYKPIKFNPQDICKSSFGAVLTRYNIVFEVGVFREFYEDTTDKVGKFISKIAIKNVENRYKEVFNRKFLVHRLDIADSESWNESYVTHWEPLSPCRSLTNNTSSYNKDMNYNKNLNDLIMSARWKEVNELLDGIKASSIGDNSMMTKKDKQGRLALHYLCAVCHSPLSLLHTFLVYQAQGKK